ncbi:Hypothetical predicted protein [Marmota monax]|uniref:Uncharacterized protein n=1 Tax=Marmota monax TaxID=9995 RepID=A0A5E4B346_MARMO|nr:Hypothetical predicted protein [Marmota monax]
MTRQEGRPRDATGRASGRKDSDTDDEVKSPRGVQKGNVQDSQRRCVPRGAEESSEKEQTQLEKCGPHSVQSVFDRQKYQFTDTTPSRPPVLRSSSGPSLVEKKKIFMKNK